MSFFFFSFFFPGKEYMIQHTRALGLCILMWVSQSRNQSTPIYPGWPCAQHSARGTNTSEEIALPLLFGSLNGVVKICRSQGEGSAKVRSQGCVNWFMFAMTGKGLWKASDIWAPKFSLWGPTSRNPELTFSKKHVDRKMRLIIIAKVSS